MPKNKDDTPMSISKKAQTKELAPKKPVPTEIPKKDPPKKPVAAKAPAVIRISLKEPAPTKAPTKARVKEPASKEAPAETKTAKVAARLLQLDLAEVPSVPNRGVPTLCRIKDVHDADTITVVVCLGKAPLCLRVRVEHVDAPEVTVKRGTRKLGEADIARAELEKTAGLKVRAYVAQLLKQNCPLDIAEVVLTGLDKYGGRYLGDLFLADKTCLSQHLLQRGFVRKYEGDKKQSWSDAELRSIINALPNF